MAKRRTGPGRSAVGRPVDPGSKVTGVPVDQGMHFRNGNVVSPSWGLLLMAVAGHVSLDDPVGKPTVPA
jgi:hypothetical protein